jgi:hypothetical protein
MTYYVGVRQSPNMCISGQLRTFAPALRPCAHSVRLVPRQWSPARDRYRNVRCRTCVCLGLPMFRPARTACSNERTESISIGQLRSFCINERLQRSLQLSVLCAKQRAARRWLAASSPKQRRRRQLWQRQQPTELSGFL